MTTYVDPRETLRKEWGWKWYARHAQSPILPGIYWTYVTVPRIDPKIVIHRVRVSADRDGSGYWLHYMDLSKRSRIQSLTLKRNGRHAWGIIGPGHAVDCWEYFFPTRAMALWYVMVLNDRDRKHRYGGTWTARRPIPRRKFKTPHLGG